MRQEDTMTAQEAKAEFLKVGLSESTLRRWARDGRIHRVKAGVYSRPDVLVAVSKAIEKQTGRVSHSPKKYLRSQVRLATVDDADGMATLIAAIFGGAPNPDRWASWIKRNPSIGYVGVSNGMVISCGLVVPFEEHKILNILVQEITPPTDPKEILLYKPGTHVCLYARTICVAETDEQGNKFSYAQRKIWAGSLLRGITKGIISLGSKGVIIDKAYGRSDTSDGERAMRNMGFTEIKTTTSHHNFVIDFPLSGLNMVLRYENQFIEWQRTQFGRG